MLRRILIYAEILFPNALPTSGHSENICFEATCEAMLNARHSQILLQTRDTGIPPRHSGLFPTYSQLSIASFL